MAGGAEGIAIGPRLVPAHDALAVRHDHVDALPLPAVTYDEIVAVVNGYLGAPQDHEEAHPVDLLSRMDEVVTRTMVGFGIASQSQSCAAWAMWELRRRTGPGSGGAQRGR